MDQNKGYSNCGEKTKLYQVSQVADTSLLSKRWEIKYSHKISGQGAKISELDHEDTQQACKKKKEWEMKFRFPSVEIFETIIFFFL